MDVDDIARVLLREGRLEDELPVILVRDETDFHAVLLVGDLEATFPGYRASVAFGEFAQWKQSPGKLFLLQREKKVTLVLAPVAATLEQMTCPVCAFLDVREMAGGDLAGPQLTRPMDKRAELQLLVAHHARVWSSARSILFGEVLNDLPLNLFGLIDQVVGNVQLV